MRYTVPAFFGFVLTLLFGMGLSRVAYQVRDDAIVWLIWCIPFVLLLPLFRKQVVNGFIVSCLVTSVFVMGLIGAGVAGPSTIAGGFASAWILMFVVGYGVLWAIINRFWPRTIDKPE